MVWTFPTQSQREADIQTRRKTDPYVINLPGIGHLLRSFLVFGALRRLRFPNVLVFGLLSALAIVPVRAQTGALPETIERSLVASATGERAASVELAAMRAVAERPDLVAQIVARAVALEPARADEIAGALSRAYPGFAETISTAAAGVNPDAAPAIARRVSDSVPEFARETVAVPETSDTTVWDGEIEVGGTRTTGNSENEDFFAAAEITSENDDWVNRLRGQYDLSRTDNETNARRLFLGFKTRYNFYERFFAFGLIEYEDDAFSGFDYRLSQNAGIGYRLIPPEPVSLDVEAGPGVRFSKREDTGLTETEATFRIGEVFTWRISDNAELTNESSMTFGEEQTITESDTSLTTDIADDIAVRVSYEVRNNSDPPPGREKTDTTLRASIIYEPF